MQCQARTAMPEHMVSDIGRCVRDQTERCDGDHAVLGYRPHDGSIQASVVSWLRRTPWQICSGPCSSGYRFRGGNGTTVPIDAAYAIEIEAPHISIKQ